MDFVVMGLFENQAALSTFLIHPNQQQGVLMWQKIASWQVVDIEIGSETTNFAGLLNSWVDFSMASLE